MASSELACAYAIMILYEEEIPVSAEKISTIVKAANVNVDSYWFGLFAKLAQNKNIGDFIVNSGGAGGAAVAVAAPDAAAGGGGGAAAAPAAEEKKEEPKEESDDDMGFSLFD